MGAGGREYQDFLTKVFCFTLLKNFVVEPFSVKLISAFEIVYVSEGYVTISHRKVFVSQYRNIS